MGELERIATFIEAAKELGYDVILSPYFDCHQGYAPQTMPCQTPAGMCDCPERSQLFVVRSRCTAAAGPATES
jgi:hypothetical protein